MGSRYNFRLMCGHSPVASTGSLVLLHFHSVLTATSSHVNYSLVILGWVIVALLGLLYALSPRLRKMIPRYFWNHRFYQEAVRRGRETIPVETTIILFALCAAAGLTVSVWLDQVHMAESFTKITTSLPGELQTATTELVRRSWLSVAFVGALTGLVGILWAGCLVAAAHRLGNSIRYEQALMITVWPHWILLLVAGIAWVTAGTAALDTHLLSWIGLLGAMYAAVRVWIDFRVIARVRPVYLLFLIFTTPLVVCVIAAIIFTYESSLDTALLWQLITGGGGMP